MKKLNKRAQKELNNVKMYGGCSCKCGCTGSGRTSAGASQEVRYPVKEDKGGWW